MRDWLLYGLLAIVLVAALASVVANTLRLFELFSQ